jgi:hypothetical protein
VDPKRTAVIVLAAIAAIVVLISVIAGAIAVLPRDNRYAIGSQTSYAPPPSPAANFSTPAASAPTTSTTPTPTPGKRDLPRPVLAPASPQVVPNKAAVANKIRAVKVKGMTGSYSGSVVEVGTGQSRVRAQCHPWLHSRIDHEAAHVDGCVIDLGARAHLHNLGGHAEAGSDHFGRWRRSVPG